jgi:BASS family bile acid:Na+ symporter
MEATVLTKVVLPIALGIVMLGLGLGLRLEDFTRVVRKPKAALIGIACQMLLLPLLAFAIVKAFAMPAELAVGLVILALCPGGATSNMFSLLARGDVALSVSLTAVVSVITPLTIPIAGGFAMSALMGANATLELPILKTILTLFAITLVPVTIGMAIRHFASSFAERCDRAVRVLSIVLLAVIILGILKNTGADKVKEFFALAGWPALALNMLSILAGVGIARLASLRREQVVTIGMEVGLQNGTTALFVTGTVLQSPTMSIAPAIYSLLMFATGAAFAFAVTSRLARSQRTASSRA